MNSVSPRGKKPAKSPKPSNGPALPRNRRVKNVPLSPAPSSRGKFTTRGDAEAHWPATAVELWEVGRVAPYEKNPRLHAQGQVEQIAESIRQWGFTIPLLVDESGRLIAGHARLEAAKLLNLPRVPVLIARGWTDLQQRAYVIADNRLAMNSSWDDGLLLEELTALKLSDFDLAALGFTDTELAALVHAPDSSVFLPGEEGEQPRLDERAPIICPNCGHAWQPVATN